MQKPKDYVLHAASPSTLKAQDVLHAAVIIVFHQVEMRGTWGGRILRVLSGPDEIYIFCHLLLPPFQFIGLT